LAVDATGLNVYRIEKDGWAGLQFTIIPALDLPGLCNSLSGCSPTVSGLGYDATTDTLWYLPQGSQRVYHFDTSGQPQGYFDVRNVPDCATNAATGIAAGAGVLYLTAGGCGRGFQYAKSDSGAGTKLSSFSAGGPQSAGAACDNVSFSSITALWTRDASTGHLRAIEVPAGTCVAGGGVSFAGTGMWMAGSGQSQGTGALPLGTGPFAVPKIQIAYHLLCDPSAGAQPSNPGGPPNNMVINWSAPDATDPTATDHFSFHLQQLVLNKCQFTATQAPLGFRNPPCQPASNNTCFNTMQGTGLGSLRGRGPNGQVILGGTNCDKCGQVDFYFQDAGEPNTYDVISFQVTDVNSMAGVLENCPALDCSRANNQAHQQSQ